MDEKEKQVQAALGTRTRQMFIVADWKDIDGLINDFKEALENFDLFMYSHPECEGSDMHGFIISDEQLNGAQINKLCECEYLDEEDKE